MYHTLNVKRNCKLWLLKAFCMNNAENLLYKQCNYTELNTSFKVYNSQTKIIKEAIILVYIRSHLKMSKNISEH